MCNLSWEEALCTLTLLRDEEEHKAPVKHCLAWPKSENAMELSFVCMVFSSWSSYTKICIIQRCLKNAQDGWGLLSRKGQFEGCGRVNLICQIATNVAFLFKERFAEVLKWGAGYFNQAFGPFGCSLRSVLSEQHIELWYGLLKPT